MKNLIKKSLTLLGLNVTLLNRSNAFNQLGINKSNAKFFADGSIMLNDFGLLVDEKKHAYILKGVRIMYELKKKMGAGFELNKNDVFLIRIASLVYSVQTWEELFILNEIFIKGVYNFLTSEPFTLIDIGMNVAYSSIFFANIPECNAVYSFEPFRDTYNQAIYNISLNPLLKDKIIPSNYGLGDGNTLLTVSYNKEIKGNMGINGIPDYLKDQFSAASQEQIDIQDASDALGPVIRKARQLQTKVVLKIDCEGSEYAIFDSFAKSSILNDCSVIILEWHFKGCEKISAQLREAGFSLFSFDHHNEMSGMVYAFNNSIQIAS